MVVRAATRPALTAESMAVVKVSLVGLEAHVIEKSRYVFVGKVVSGTTVRLAELLTNHVQMLLGFHAFVNNVGFHVFVFQLFPHVVIAGGEIFLLLTSKECIDDLMGKYCLGHLIQQT